MLITRYLKLEFPKNLTKEPFVCNAIKRFEIEANIRRADVTATGGWIVLAITGSSAQVDAAEAYLREAGVQISLVEAELN